MKWRVSLTFSYGRLPPPGTHIHVLFLTRSFWWHQCLYMCSSNISDVTHCKAYLWNHWHFSLKKTSVKLRKVAPRCKISFGSEKYPTYAWLVRVNKSSTSMLVQVDPWSTGPRINPGQITHSSNFSSSTNKRMVSQHYVTQRKISIPCSHSANLVLENVGRGW